MATMFGTKIVTVPTAGIIFGQKVVSSDGTDEQLTTNSTVLTHGVHLSVVNASDIIFIGLEGVSAATGYRLITGQQLFIPCDNASLFWIDAAAADDAVSFMAV